MMISDKQINQVVRAYTNKVEGAYKNKVEPAEQKKVQKKDKVDLSEQALEIKKLQEKIGPLDEVRTDRVEKIKYSVDTGTYKVDGQDVAAKMLGRAYAEKLFSGNE